MEKKQKKTGKIILMIVGILLTLALFLAAAFFIMKATGAKKLRQQLAEQEMSGHGDAQLAEEGRMITYQGKKYRYNENLITILVMGIDRELQDEEERVIGTNGQADTLFLAVLDSKTGEASLISISRDSMVEVDQYNIEGGYIGRKRMQVCLSYAYGDGREKSCLNTVAAVSRLMYGIPINAYAAIDYSGISKLNDAIGGVPVEIQGDLRYDDPQMQPGNVVRLNGKQAHLYVRGRDTEVLDSNNDRMKRQKQYLLAFINEALKAAKKDLSLPVKLYQEAADYSVTNISASEVAYLASIVLEHGFTEKDLRSIPGEVIQGEEYAEFIPDEEKVFELILEVFYNEQ